MNTPDSALSPISLEEARQRRRDNAFIEEWIQRSVRRYRVSGPELRELRSAGTVGALQAVRDWESLPPGERTEERRRQLIARGVRNEVRAAWHAMVGKAQHKRAAALEEATRPGDDYEGLGVRERLRDMRAHMNHDVYAGLLHGSLGMESPEDAYLDAEQEKLDRDRLDFAIARLEDADDQLLAHKLLIEGTSLTDACAAVGIHEKSKRTRARARLLKQMRQHAVVFASSLGPRRKRNDDGDGGASA